MKSRGEKFLTPEEEKAMAETWQKSSVMLEQTYKEEDGKRVKEHEYDYVAGRLESRNSTNSIDHIHQTSFIKEIIPELIRRNQGTKVRVIDLGAGAALYADQIRESFPHGVEVYSTGLSKRTAEKYREFSKLKKLHPNDLKWRSVRQMSDSEEFDLIIDTWGEQFYTAEDSGNAIKDLEAYLLAVIKKLKPGGMASIAPVNLGKKINSFQFHEVLDSIRRGNKIKAEFPVNGRNILRIEKIESNAK